MGTAPPPAVSCLDNEWRRRSDSLGMDQGRTFLESFESLSPLHQTVAQTAGLQYWRRIQSEIYLSGRMRTVLLKWQYEP